MPTGTLFRVGDAVNLRLIEGDITKLHVDAIVNAANSALAGGGGVDGAIHAAGGTEIMAELELIRKRIGRCQPGDAVVTRAGHLPARYVFHTVGPRYRDGNQGESGILQSCYQTCLRLAKQLELQVISFPSVSTGVYGYPVKAAAQVALRAVVSSVRSDPGSLREVKLVQFSSSDAQIYREAAERVFEKSASAG